MYPLLPSTLLAETNLGMPLPPNFALECEWEIYQRPTPQAIKGYRGANRLKLGKWLGKLGSMLP